MKQTGGNKRAALNESLKRGAIWEIAIASFLSALGFTVTRNDKDALGNADFELTCAVDVKHHSIPFRLAKKLVGLDPAETIAIDSHKVLKYAKQNAFVFLIVDYRPDFPTFGCYFISGKKLALLMKKHPQRKMKLGTQKQYPHPSQETFHFLTSECFRFPDLVFEGIKKAAGK
jgi:hypothetical protein